MQQQRGTLGTAIGLGGMPPLRSTGLARTAQRLGTQRVTPRRDPELDDRERMIKVMVQSLDKMLARLGLQPV